MITNWPSQDEHCNAKAGKSEMALKYNYRCLHEAASHF